MIYKILVPSIVSTLFFILAIAMYKYLVDMYTVENNLEKGFKLVKTNNWFIYSE